MEFDADMLNSILINETNLDKMRYLEHMCIWCEIQRLNTNSQGTIAENSHIPSNIGTCAQKRSLGRDLDPGPLPYQGNALPG